MALSKRWKKSRSNKKKKRWTPRKCGEWPVKNSGKHGNEKSLIHQPEKESRQSLEYLKKKEESNRQNTEWQLNIREKELKVEKQTLDVQQGMQNQMLEQLRMQQQSQEAMFNLFQTFADRLKQFFVIVPKQIYFTHIIIN